MGIHSIHQHQLELLGDWDCTGGSNLPKKGLLGNVTFMHGPSLVELNIRLRTFLGQLVQTPNQQPELANKPSGTHRNLQPER